MLTAASSTDLATWISLLLLALSAGVYSVQARELINQRREFVKQTNEFVRQTNHAIDTNRAILSQNVNGSMSGLSRLFFDHPDLRCYFYGGVNPPVDEPERTRVEILAEMFVDFMSLALTNEVLAPSDERAGWETYFCDIAGKSPALREFWSAHHDWYEARLQRLLDPIITECSSPPTPEDG
jgi:hypothetical protein